MLRNCQVFFNHKWRIMVKWVEYCLCCNIHRTINIYRITILKKYSTFNSDLSIRITACKIGAWKTLFFSRRQTQVFKIPLKEVIHLLRKVPSRVSLWVVGIVQKIMPLNQGYITWIFIALFNIFLLWQFQKNDL